MNETKLCPKCQEVKPLCEFYIYKTGKNVGRLYGYCKECRKIYNQTYSTNNREKNRLRKLKYYQDNPERSRLIMIKYLYGLSEEEYKALPKKCGICGSVENLNVDHNHITGKVRGVLCGTCNRGIGMFKDSSWLLIRSAFYILKNSNQRRL